MWGNVASAFSVGEAVVRSMLVEAAQVCIAEE